MPISHEQAIHINVINWFNYQFPELAEDFHHFANERKCTVQQGRLLKRMGVKKGVSDFFLALPMDGYFGFWLELKVGSNKPTPEQKAFLERKTARGYLCAVCWGYDDAKELLLNYLLNYDGNSNSINLNSLSKNKPIC